MKCTIIIISFFINSILIAQVKDTYVAATIELNNNEKLEGFIKDDEVRLLNYKVFYKPNLLQRDAKKIDTSSIYKVSISNGEIYKALKVKPNNKNDSLTVLGKQILTGDASLYELYYDNDHIFIVEKNGVTYFLQDDKFEHNSLTTTKYYFKDYLMNALDAKNIILRRISSLTFSKGSITKLIEDYNTSVNSKSTKTKTKLIPITYVFADIGGNSFKPDDKEMFMQLFARMYIPKLSKNTSLNVGLSYYSAKFSSQNYGSTVRLKYAQKLLSMPIQIQHNIFNKKARPYIFAGANISYIKVREVPSFANPFQTGFQANFGIAGLWGGGIEVDFLKNARIKCEFRNENYIHVLLFGLGIYLKK